MPRVSVCMASFNHEKYVRAAVESALAQSFQDLEILVTDDGSKDGTVDEIRAIRDPRVSMEVFPKNRRACLAKNACIRRSKGEYIANLNSDDLFLPGKLEQQVRFLDAHPEVGAVFGYLRLLMKPDGTSRTTKRSIEASSRSRTGPDRSGCGSFSWRGIACATPQS